MTGREKLYFLLDTIDDVRTITPSGQSLAISLANNLNGKLSAIELSLLFTKLEKDEHALKLLREPNRLETAIYGYDPKDKLDDGRYHFELLPAFDKYFLKIQYEPEYQEFTGKKPNPKKNHEINYGKVGVSAEVLVSDLQAKYLEIQDEKTDSNFYLKVANYGKYLNDSNVSRPILSQLYRESQSQIVDLSKSWKEFFEIWRGYAQNLIDVADAKGIKDEGPLQNEIEEVRTFLDQPDPQFSGDEIPHYFRSYQEIIWRFNKLGKGNIIAKKHLNEDGNIRLYLEFNKVEIEWDKFKMAREISTWWAHYQISRLACGVFGNKEEKEQYFKDDNEIDKLYKYEFEELSRNPSYAPVIIKRKKFEEWITILHGYLLPRLKEAFSSHGTDFNNKYNQLLEEMKASSENQLLELNKRYEELIAQISFQTLKTPRTPKELPNTTSEDLIKCIDLTYSLDSNVLKYQNGKEIDASPETREMKFFLTLYKKRGQTVDYKEIARDANLQSYKDAVGENEVAYEELKNLDFSEDASLLRRDFRTMVMSLGMPGKVFSKMITTIRKKGYKLVCK